MGVLEESALESIREHVGRFKLWHGKNRFKIRK